MNEAVRLKVELSARFAGVELTMSEEKTHIVYIDTFPRWGVPFCFTFLGYDFRVRTLRSFKGELFRQC